MDADAKLDHRKHHHSQRVRLPLIGAYLGAVFVAEGCSDMPTRGESLPSAAAVQASVTGPALLGLNESGRFTSLETQSEGELRAEGAIALANAYTKRLLPFILTALETGRGGKVNSRNLAVCGRLLYAAGTMDALAPEVPIPFHRLYGAYWLVTLCSLGEPQVSLAVSALATDLQIENGEIVFPPISGNEFFAAGIPVGHTGEFPVSPEKAVVVAAERTGRRVAAVPRLLMPLNTQGTPQDASWQIDLESVAVFHNYQGGDVSLQNVFLSNRLNHAGRSSVQFATPAPDQPGDISFQYFTPIIPGESEAAYLARRALLTASAHRKTDVPVIFEKVTPSGAR